jgi:hypothetical protein
LFAGALELEIIQAHMAKAKGRVWAHLSLSEINKNVRLLLQQFVSLCSETLNIKLRSSRPINDLSGRSSVRSPLTPCLVDKPPPKFAVEVTGIRDKSKRFSTPRGAEYTKVENTRAQAGSRYNRGLTEVGLGRCYCARHSL